MSDTRVRIRQFEYRVRWQGEPLWYAVVEVQGDLLWFSRFDTETTWYCDAHFGANGFPYFCHGEGSRCCHKQAARGPLAAALYERKKDWGDRPALAPLGVPEKGR
jgi:hypothetical protein